MAAPSWSNPNPNDPTTMGAVASRFDVRAPEISGIISAILTQRYRKQQQDRQATQDLINGIGSVAGGIEKNYQSGQANDAANAALYSSLYPGDPTGAYTDPGRVPDYGGTNALNAALIKNKLTGGPDDPMADYLKAQQANEANARASQLWNNPYGMARPTNPDLNYLHSVNAANAQAKTIGSNLEATYNETPQDILNAQPVSTIPAVTNGRWFGGYSRPAETLPTSPGDQPDMYRTGQDVAPVNGKGGSAAKYLTPDAYNRAIVAARQYQQLVDQASIRQELGQGLPAPDISAAEAPPRTTTGNVGLQQDVNDAQQALRLYPGRRSEIIGRLQQKWPGTDFSSVGQ